MKTKTRFSGVRLLTAREHEVLLGLADGLRTRLIAKRLFLSVKTVQTHCQTAARKLGLSDIFALRSYAARYVVTVGKAAVRTNQVNRTEQTRQ